MKWLKNILSRMFRAGGDINRDYSGRNNWLAAQHLKVNACNRRKND